MKKHNKANRNYINQSHGITESHREKQQRKYGKHYPNIDFSFIDDTDPKEIENSTVMGTLLIGNTEINLTRMEIKKIIETLDSALVLSAKRFILGIQQ